MTDLQFLTWNIHGLNNFKKSRLIHSYLRRRKVDICFLQETHLQHSADARLRSSYWGETHTAPYSNYARGVAILIKKGIGWTTTLVKTDPRGRFLILSGRLLTTPLTLVVVYEPNVDDPNFFLHLWATITSFTEGVIIWEGDFNTVLNNELD